MRRKADLGDCGPIAALRMGITIAICAGVSLLNACQYPTTPLAKLPRLGVGIQFALENLCNVGLSPRIDLSNVPAETKTYIVKITNVDVLIQTPWREAIPATSKTEIPEGAGKTFVGPCIGDNTRFPPVAPNGYTYRVEVLAADAAGKSLAYGWTNVLVQSPYLTARRMRVLQQQGKASLQNGRPQPSPIQTQPGLLPGQQYQNFSPGIDRNSSLLQ